MTDNLNRKEITPVTSGRASVETLRFVISKTHVRCPALPVLSGPRESLWALVYSLIT